MLSTTAWLFVGVYPDFLFKVLSDIKNKEISGDGKKPFPESMRREIL